MHIATITIKFTFHLDGLIKIVITGVQGRGGAGELILQKLKAYCV